eukprot:scaffold1699_cov114-Isochrysis_galbana.AAC.6
MVRPAEGAQTATVCRALLRAAAGARSNTALAPSAAAASMRSRWTSDRIRAPLYTCIIHGCHKASVRHAPL